MDGLFVQDDKGVTLVSEIEASKVGGCIFRGIKLWDAREVDVVLGEESEDGPEERA